MPASRNASPYLPAFLVVLAMATALRLPQLSLRPMHTDEAVHAVKFGALLEDGLYRYDPAEYHGPTLNYLTLIPAWIESVEHLADIDEATLRVVPVAFGLATLLLLPLLVGGLGRETVGAAAVLAAVSPAMVFYSRYYIQETLLVFFTFAAIVCGYRYLRAGRGGWAAAAGASFGLMHATKETAIIALAAIFLALGLTLWTASAVKAAPAEGELDDAGSGSLRGALRGTASPLRSASRLPARLSRLPQHVLIAVVAAAGVSALFYSSFLTNPAGIVDSYATYLGYLGRAAGHPWHVHPWHYYVGMLAYFRAPAGPVWSEGFILLLAAIGIAAVAAKKDLPGVDPALARFVCFYTIALLALYSAIPYKTPWSMLSALHGLTLLGGIGAVAVLRTGAGKPLRLALACLLLVGVVDLARQSYRASYEDYADPSNPYVYAHPTRDVIRIADRIQALADAHPDGNDLYIQVICPGSDYWPLPWYLRRFPNVGWWDDVDMSVPAAPVILAAPAVESRLLEKLYELPPPGQRNLYVPLFAAPVELRPSIEIRGYVVNDLWDSYKRRLEPEADAKDGQSTEKPAG